MIVEFTIDDHDIDPMTLRCRVCDRKLFVIQRNRNLLLYCRPLAERIELKLKGEMEFHLFGWREINGVLEGPNPLMRIITVKKGEGKDLCLHSKSMTYLDLCLDMK